MIRIRKSSDRGHIQWDWLDTYHSFSFGDYYDPENMGFRALRVINDDRVAPANGFPMHPHRDMEIVTYVLAGAVGHKDSMGNGSVIMPGDVQRMSAGKGIVHSEWNNSKTEPVHLLQIWLLPEQQGITPSYEQKTFSADEKRNQLRLIAAPAGLQNNDPSKNGAVEIHQDARVFASVLSKDASIEHTLAPGRHAWLQVARGAVTLNGQPLSEGDGAALSDEQQLALAGVAPESEVLLFDLA
ncbi:MAG: pirin family protein [Acidobacteriota bacterium]|nr:pirin family protein [Acidobacteriota bacterium]